jgi:tetratricopeptide (TPR) repeat protein
MTSKNKNQRPTGWLASRDQIDALMASASQALMDKDYPTVLSICKRALHYLPIRAPERGEVYALMGNAYAMQQRFEESYQALSKAIEVNPSDSYHWYNRSMSCRYTFRIGQALRDIERAIELEGNGKMAKDFAKELAFNKKLVKSDLALRGRGFTVEQLIEQQDWFQKGLQAVEKKDWEAGQQAFQHSIDLGDCLPQPQGNRGMCLLMLRRYDEAEKALKRALELDSKYEFARRNLAVLKEVRETGVLPLYGGIQSPFEGTKLKSGITFVKDDNDPG